MSIASDTTEIFEFDDDVFYSSGDVRNLTAPNIVAIKTTRMETTTIETTASKSSDERFECGSSCKSDEDDEAMSYIDLVSDDEENDEKDALSSIGSATEDDDEVSIIDLSSDGEDDSSVDSALGDEGENSDFGSKKEFKSLLRALADRPPTPPVPMRHINPLAKLRALATKFRSRSKIISPEKLLASKRKQDDELEVDEAIKRRKIDDENIHVQFQKLVQGSKLAEYILITNANIQETMFSKIYIELFEKYRKDFPNEDSKLYDFLMNTKRSPKISFVNRINDNITKNFLCSPIANRYDPNFCAEMRLSFFQSFDIKNSQEKVNEEIVKMTVASKLTVNDSDKKNEISFIFQDLVQKSPLAIFILAQNSILKETQFTTLFLKHYRAIANNENDEKLFKFLSKRSERNIKRSPKLSFVEEVNKILFGMEKSINWDPILYVKMRSILLKGYDLNKNVFTCMDEVLKSFNFVRK